MSVLIAVIALSAIGFASSYSLVLKTNSPLLRSARTRSISTSLSATIVSPFDESSGTAVAATGARVLEV